MKYVFLFMGVLVLGLLAGCNMPANQSNESIVCVPSSVLQNLSECEQPQEPTAPVEEPETPVEEAPEQPEVPIEEPEVPVEEPETPVEEPEVEPTGPVKTYKEGDLVKLSPTASDPDNDVVTFTFSEPLDENGEWQTEVGDAGTYVVTITADDGKTKVNQDITLVIEAANAAPVLNTLEDVTVNEGETVEFSPEAADPEGEPVTITYSGWMTTNSYTTTFDDAGTHTVTVTVSDGKMTDSQDVTVTVVDVNRAPVIGPLSNVAVTEGEVVKVSAEATDEDADDVTITFSDPLDENGEWQTAEGDAGAYTATVTASDGKAEDTKVVSIVVNAKNQAPIIEVANTMTVNENELVTVSPVVTDADGDEVAVSFSEPLDANGEWQTDYNSAGTYVVTITATDGTNTATAEVTITVNDVNRPPIFEV